MEGTITCFDCWHCCTYREEREEYRRKMDDLQMQRSVEDRKRKDAQVHQLKLFCDAMKGSALRMTNDSLDLVPFSNILSNCLMS
jgi:hypothetical protein